MTDLPRRPLVGVSACVFRAGHVLLVERAKAPFEGLWSLPGGHVAFGERLKDAVRRELCEETGIEVDHFLFERVHEAIEETSGTHAVILVHRAADDLPAGRDPIAGDDARACRFIEVEALAGMERQGRLTDGLAEIVASAHRAHLLGR